MQVDGLEVRLAQVRLVGGHRGDVHVLHRLLEQGDEVGGVARAGLGDLGCRDDLRANADHHVERDPLQLAADP